MLDTMITKPSLHLIRASLLIAATLLAFSALLAIKQITVVTSTTLSAGFRTLDYRSQTRAGRRADVCARFIVTVSWTRHCWNTMVKTKILMIGRKHFTVTFDQFNTSLLNKNIIFLKTNLADHKLLNSNVFFSHAVYDIITIGFKYILV